MAEASASDAVASSSNGRIIGFLDMDSFEVQLYQNKDWPDYRGRPCIVVADYESGRIVSVSPEAKKLGITRSMRESEAKQIYPRLGIITKPYKHNKSDAKTARHGSYAVHDSLKSYCDTGLNVVLEKHSSDGFYIDPTEEVDKRMEERDSVEVCRNVFMEPSNEMIAHEQMTYTREHVKAKVISESEYRLMFAVEYFTELVDHLRKETNIVCSVGISSNKLMAKYACQLHKPSGMTLLPLDALPQVAERVPIKEIPGYGKRMGEYVMGNLSGISNLQQLVAVPFEVLMRKFGRGVGRELYNGARGICDEPVVVKGPNKGVTCAKNFQGESRVMKFYQLHQHVQHRTAEMEERLREEKERHSRKTNSLCLEIHFIKINRELDRKRTKFENFEGKLTDKEFTFDIVEKVLTELKDVIDDVIDKDGDMCVTRIALVAREWEKVDVELESQAAPPPSIVAPELPPGQVFELKISIEEAEPTIWRVIHIDQNFNFRQLHHAILDAIGWKHDSSLPHEFELISGRLSVGKPSRRFAHLIQILPEKSTPISMILREVGDAIIYQRGINRGAWPHVIKLEAIRPKETRTSYPICIDGEGATPRNEDVGVLAYNELLTQYKNIQGLVQQHLSWAAFDPNVFRSSQVVFGNHEDDSESDDSDSEEDSE